MQNVHFVKPQYVNLHHNVSEQITSVATICAEKAHFGSGIEYKYFLPRKSIYENVICKMSILWYLNMLIPITMYLTILHLWPLFVLRRLIQILEVEWSAQEPGMIWWNAINWSPHTSHWSIEVTGKWVELYNSPGDFHTKKFVIDLYMD